MKKRTILILSFLLLSISSIYAQKQPIPELTERVVDFSHTLSKQEINFLKNSLSDIESETGTQIAILIVNSIGSESIEDFSMRVAEKWKIGSKNKDDGIILVITMKDRKIRIEVGYGLEETIPDAIAKRIINEKIIPEFKKSNYYMGINLAVIQFEYLLKGQPSIANTKSKKEKNRTLNFLFISLISSVILLLGFALFKNIKTKNKKNIIILITAILIILGSIGLFYLFLSFNAILQMFLIIGGIILLLAVTAKFMGAKSSGSRRYSSSSSSSFSSSGSSSIGGGGSFGGGGASGSW